MAARIVDFVRSLPKAALIAAAAGLTLAAIAGVLAAAVLGAGSQEPTRTVTVNVGTGEQGVPGPPGPKGDPGPPGPAGATECNAGYSFATLVINAPGGQVTLQTCIKDG